LIWVAELKVKRAYSRHRHAAKKERAEKKEASTGSEQGAAGGTRGGERSTGAEQVGRTHARTRGDRATDTDTQQQRREQIEKTEAKTKGGGGVGKAVSGEGKAGRTACTHPPRSEMYSM